MPHPDAVAPVSEGARFSQPDAADGFQHPGENRLLAALSPERYDALRPHLESVQCGIKDIIYRPHEPIEHVYFPISGVFSLLSAGDKEDELIEVATVGNEGFISIPVFLGADSTAGMCFSQVPGTSLRMTAGAFRDAVSDNGELTAILNRYTLALFTQISQAAFCNRVHPMVQRCARWMLQTEDRVDQPEFPMTHEFLSQMLGVRRATVTEAVGALQDEGLIRYARGMMRVIDRPGLEAASCECYRIIQEEHRRLIGV